MKNIFVLPLLLGLILVGCNNSSTEDQSSATLSNEISGASEEPSITSVSS